MTAVEFDARYVDLIARQFLFFFSTESELHKDL